MKQLLLVLTLCSLYYLPSQAQSGWTYDSSGNGLLIGSNTGYNSSNMLLGGNIGILQQSQNVVGHVSTLRFVSFNSDGVIGVRYNGTFNADMVFGVNNGFWGGSRDVLERMRIKANGNVGIGIENPGSYKLNVWGRLRAHEIVVNTTGADFVFADDYQLNPLTEVEKFIKEKKHLPEIPSAEEMQKDGVSLGDLQIKILQKVEELTLYLIELQKQNEALQKENEVIKEEILKLKNG